MNECTSGAACPGLRAHAAAVLAPASVLTRRCRMSHEDPCIWQVSQFDRGTPLTVDDVEEPRAGCVATLSDDRDPAARTTEGDLEAVHGPAAVEAAVDAGPSSDTGHAASAEAAEPVDVIELPADGDQQVSAADVPGDADGPAGLEPAAAAGTRGPRRRSSLRRGAALATVVVAAALAVSAFATGGTSTADVDQRFVDVARSQGHAVVPGDQQMLLVSAAHKICDRRENHTTVAERRATALSIGELAAIDHTFGADSRGFTSLALDTYCAS